MNPSQRHALDMTKNTVQHFTVDQIIIKVTLLGNRPFSGWFHFQSSLLKVKKKKKKQMP